MPHSETLRAISGTHEISHPRFNMQELQQNDVVEAVTIEDFHPSADVTVSLEKSNDYKEKVDKPCQDAFVVDSETGLVAVLDGVGSTAGDRASRRGAETLVKNFKEAKQHILDRHVTTEVMSERIREFLRRDNAQYYVDKFIDIDPTIIHTAYQLAYSFVLTHNEVKASKAATTMDAGLLHTTPDGRTFYIGANAGDSPTYLQHGSTGRIEKLTQEDSFLETAIKTGGISPELLEKMKADPNGKHAITLTVDLLKEMGYSNEDAQQNAGKAYPTTYRKLKSTLFNGLGGDRPPRPSIIIEEVFPKDRIILVTDGVSDMFESEATGEVQEEEMQAALEGGTDADSVNRLRQIAGTKTAVNKDSDDRAIVMLSIHEVAEDVTDELIEMVV